MQHFSDHCRCSLLQRPKTQRSLCCIIYIADYVLYIGTSIFFLFCINIVFLPLESKTQPNEFDKIYVFLFFNKKVLLFFQISCKTSAIPLDIFQLSNTFGLLPKIFSSIICQEFGMIYVLSLVVQRHHIFWCSSNVIQNLCSKSYTKTGLDQVK